MPDTRGEVTRLLAEVKLGGKDVLDQLITLVYGELRRIASRQMKAAGWVHFRGYEYYTPALV